MQTTSSQTSTKSAPTWLTTLGLALILASQVIWIILLMISTNYTWLPAPIGLSGIASFLLLHEGSLIRLASSLNQLGLDLSNPDNKGTLPERVARMEEDLGAVLERITELEREL